MDLNAPEHFPAILPDLDAPKPQKATDPTISVIAVIRNAAEVIEQSLLSVLQQTRPPMEILVIDAASTDNSARIVARMAATHQITLISLSSGDLIAARNLGISRASGDLIGLLEQNCRWYPTLLHSLARPFQVTTPRPLGWSYGNADKVAQDGDVLVRSMLPASRTGSAPLLHPETFGAPYAALIERHAIQMAGGFDEHMGAFACDDLFRRLLKRGHDCAFINRPLMQWRPPEDQTDTSAGRQAYASKLILENPDEQDVIAASFAAAVLKDARKALAATDEPWIARCFSELAFLDLYLKQSPASDLCGRDRLISVVVPLYNGAPYIEEALRSAVDQTRKPDEIIVIDDGSTDGGADIVRRLANELPIRLISQDNAGQSAARNLGVARSHGDLIAFLDQDDIWYPNHLQDLARAFEQKRQTPIGWAYSDLDEVDEAGRMIRRSVLLPNAQAHPKRDLMLCLSQDMFILPSATLVSRQAFQAVGGFDPRLSGYEDDDLFLRMFRAGYDNVYLNHPLSKWRIFSTSSSYSSRMATSRMIYVRMLIQHYPDDIERQRYYVTNMIAPRFFRLIASDLRRAILKRDRLQEKRALQDLSFIVGYLRLSRRVPLRLFVLPALRIPTVARLAARYPGPLAGMLRRLL